VPADQWLRQPDFLDQVGDGGVAAGETPNDPQAVDVGEGLVDDPQLAKVLGFVDDRRKGRTNAGARGGQSVSPVGVGLLRRVTSTAVYINRS
jgi:hypothetical protein